MRLVVVFALLAVLAVAVPASRVSSGQQSGMTRHVLDNGLVVIIKENPSSDLVVTEALVRAGPRLEDPATSGTTFFLRGMLVRGTERRTGAEIAQTIESLGGQLGGGTGADFTTLYTITPSRHVDVAMEVLADLLTHARVDPQDVETQRRVSLSRINQNADQPLARALDLFNGALYPYHPYAQSVFGTAESVNALTRGQLVEFYHRHFTAPNMVLVVAGNITQAAALEKVKRVFAGLRADPVPRRIRWLRLVERALAPTPGASLEVRESRSIAAAWITLGYLGVQAGHRDFAALRVLNAILGEGLSSRLFVEIRDKRGLAYQVSSSLALRAGPGFIRLSAGTDPPNLSTVVAGMLREVERLRAESPPADEVEKAKRGIIGRYALAREDLESQAFYLGWYEILGVGYDYDARFPQEIAQVSPADVQRVARQYLVNHVLAIVAPPTAR